MTPSRIGRPFVLGVVVQVASRAHTADPPAEFVRDLKQNDWEPKSTMATKVSVREWAVFPR